MFLEIKSVLVPLPVTLFKKRLWHRCFPVFFAKFLRTSFLTEHFGWLLLKRRSDFQTKGLKRERQRERSRVRLATKAVLQYPTLIQSSRRDRSIDVSDNIYGCLSGICCRYFFKIMNFLDRFRQYFKLFYKF